MKLPPVKRPTRVMGELAGLGRNEVQFYRDVVAPSVPVRTPGAGRRPRPGVQAMGPRARGPRRPGHLLRHDHRAHGRPGRRRARPARRAARPRHRGPSPAGSTCRGRRRWRPTRCCRWSSSRCGASAARVEKKAGGRDAVGGEAGLGHRHYWPCARAGRGAADRAARGPAPGNLYLDGPRHAPAGRAVDFQVLRRATWVATSPTSLTTLAGAEGPTGERKRPRRALPGGAGRWRGGPELDADTARRWLPPLGGLRVRGRSLRGRRRRPPERRHPAARAWPAAAALTDPRDRRRPSPPSHLTSPSFRVHARGTRDAPVVPERLMRRPADGDAARRGAAGCDQPVGSMRVTVSLEVHSSDCTGARRGTDGPVAGGDLGHDLLGGGSTATLSSPGDGRPTRSRPRRRGPRPPCRCREVTVRLRVDPRDRPVVDVRDPDRNWPLSARLGCVAHRHRGHDRVRLRGRRGPRCRRRCS